MLNWARQSDSHSGQVPDAPSCLSQYRQSVGSHRVQHRFRTGRHILSQPPFGQDVPAQVGDRDDHVRRTDVHRQN